MKHHKLLASAALLVAMAAGPAMAGDRHQAGVTAEKQANASTSTQGPVNSNGVNAADRDLGLDRARERANANSSHDTTTTARVDNSNGVNATEREFGQDRADTRANANASVHDHADAPAAQR